MQRIYIFPLVLLVLAVTLHASTITVKSPTGTALSGVSVTLISSTGTKYTATTTSTGTATVNASDGNYLYIVKGTYYMVGIADIVNGTATIGGTGATVANVSSSPIFVTVNMTATGYPTQQFTTNATLYFYTGLALNFPSQVSSYPYTYKFSSLTVNGAKQNTTSVTLVTGTNDNIVAQYTSSFLFSLPSWAIYAVIAVIAIAIVLAVTTTKATKHAVLGTSRFNKKIR
jgi:hypothetical protein